MGMGGRMSESKYPMIESLVLDFYETVVFGSYTGIVLVDDLEKILEAGQVVYNEGKTAIVTCSIGTANGWRLAPEK
jgi:hypothetical protein